MDPAGYPARDLGWMINNFIEHVPDVAHALVASSDGIPVVCSAALPADRADQLAAVTSGLTSLTQAPRGSSKAESSPRPWWRCGACADHDGDQQRPHPCRARPPRLRMGLVAYEMTLPAERADTHADPASRRCRASARSAKLAPDPGPFAYSARGASAAEPGAGRRAVSGAGPGKAPHRPRRRRGRAGSRG